MNSSAERQKYANMSLKMSLTKQLLHDLMKAFWSHCLALKKMYLQPHCAFKTSTAKGPECTCVSLQKCQCEQRAYNRGSDGIEVTVALLLICLLLSDATG